MVQAGCVDERLKKRSSSFVVRAAGRLITFGLWLWSSRCVKSTALVWAPYAASSTPTPSFPSILHTLWHRCMRARGQKCAHTSNTRPSLWTHWLSSRCTEHSSPSSNAHEVRHPRRDTLHHVNVELGFFWGEGGCCLFFVVVVFPFSGETGRQAWKEMKGGVGKRGSKGAEMRREGWKWGVGLRWSRGRRGQSDRGCSSRRRER